MPQRRKILGQHNAVGHWSNAWRRIQAQQTYAQVRALLQDKLVARGKWVDLYLPVGADIVVEDLEVVPCTCTKDTTASSDRSCLSCFGCKFAPGYLKFLHSTQFWCSAEDADFTLTGCAISTAKKANVIMMSAAETTATIETQDKSYSNPNRDTWAIKLEAYRRATGGVFTLEYSTDAGTIWTAVTLTEVTTPLIPGSAHGATGFTGGMEGNGAGLSTSGLLRWRITMTRSDAADLPPAFEILRMRRVRSEDFNPLLEKWRDDFEPGKILILRPWVQEQDTLDPGRGRLIDHLGDRTWTAPLDWFDTSLTRDTPDTRIQEYFGPHAFYTYSDGVQETTRYALTKAYYNTQFGTGNSFFTHQMFDDRRIAQNEGPTLVW